jgi:hypothetical protein
MRSLANHTQVQTRHQLCEGQIEGNGEDFKRPEAGSFRPFSMLDMEGADSRPSSLILRISVVAMP